MDVPMLIVALAQLPELDFRQRENDREETRHSKAL